MYFVTLFDYNYFSRGLALYDSLLRYYKDDFQFFVIALDQSTAVEIKNNQCLTKITLIDLEEIEQEYPELLDVKSSRTKVEYYFTLSPFLPSFILNKYSYIHRITSLDSDLLFFNTPELIFQKYPYADVLITPHNFGTENLHLEKYGRFNVSFQSFKRSHNALTCLKKWREDCINYCSDKLDPYSNNFADQKYLDEWQALFSNVQAIQLPGAGLAPWNISRYSIELDNQIISIDNEPLIYFHFHHLRFANKYQVLHGLENYYALKYTSNRGIRAIYKRYIQVLLRQKKYFPTAVRYGFASQKSLLYVFLTGTPHWFSTPFFLSHIFISNKKILSIFFQLRKYFFKNS